MTPKLAVAVWFDEFVALQLTVVAPSGKVAPETGEQSGWRPPSTMSVADGGVYVTTEPAGPFASAMMFAGTPMIVGAESTTVTPNVALPVLFDESVALQVTVVVCFAGKVLPDGGLQLTGRTPSTLSVA